MQSIPFPPPKFPAIPRQHNDAPQAPIPSTALAAGGASPPLSRRGDPAAPTLALLPKERCSADPPAPIAGAAPAPPPPLRCMLTALLSVRGAKEGGGKEGGDLPIWLHLLLCLSHAPGGRCGSPRPAERGRAAPRRGCPAQGRGGRLPPPPPPRHRCSFLSF